MAPKPIEYAREYAETAFPVYTIRELDNHNVSAHTADITRHQIEFIVEAEDTGTQLLSIQLNENDDGSIDIVQSELEEQDETQESIEKPPETPIEAARQYLEQAYPSHSLRATKTHDVEFSHENVFSHTFRFHLESNSGGTKEVEIYLNEDRDDETYEVIGTED